MPALPTWIRRCLVACAFAGLCPAAELTALSFNVYFDGDAERYAKLVKWALEQKADVITFQECTETFAKVLLAQDIAKYSCQKTPFGDGYGQITLALPRVVATRVVPLPSRMGRTALVTEIQVDADTTLSLVNVHLESLDNADRRRQQIAAIKEAMAEKRWLMIGDFNFAASDAENDALKPLVELAPTDPAVATWDPRANAIAKLTAATGEQAARIDRCLSSDPKITGSATAVKVALSDHYPIVVKIKTP